MNINSSSVNPNVSWIQSHSRDLKYTVAENSAALELILENRGRVPPPSIFLQFVGG